MELAPGMSPTGYLEDRSAFIEMMEADVCISLQRSAIELEMLAWMFSLAVR